MKILIDDERNQLPDGSLPDLILRNYTAAQTFLAGWSFNDTSDVLYVDHDLGTEDPAATGYGILCLVELLLEMQPGYQLPYDIKCVSDNGPGRQRIDQVIERLYS